MALCPYVYANWKLNESSGLIASDSSGNSLDGTLVNMEYDEWVPGKLNNCLEFESGEYVNCNNIAGFERDTAFSLEFWVKINGASGYSYLLSKQDDSGPLYRGYAIGTDNNGKIRVHFMHDGTGGDRILKILNCAINDGNWHHVVVTYDGSSTAAGIHIYMDNSEAAGYTVSFDNLTDTIQNGINFQINGRDGTKTTQCSIDEVVIYTKELSAAEVNERWNGGSGTEAFSGASPNTPSNPNPSDTAINVNYQETLTWDCTHPDGADMTYDVYFDTVNPPVNLASEKQATKSYQPSDMDSLQTYYWKIIAYDGCGHETSSPTWSFTTGNENPVIPSSPNPAHTTTGISVSGTTLSWQCTDPNPNDSGSLVYDVYFGTASNPPLIKASHGSKSYNLPVLSYDTKYYWKIVARDQHGAENSSPIWNFSTQEEGLGGYTGFDIRETIRSHFCSVEYKPGSELTEYYFKVEDEIGDDIHIPMYLSEEVRSKEMKEMPFLDMGLAMTTFEPCDIAAASRKKEAYVDIGLWYTDTDNIDRTEFGNNIIDKLIDYIRSNQCNFTNIDFINVEDVRLLRETRAHQVVYHWIITVYCVYWDNIT